MVEQKAHQLPENLASESIDGVIKETEIGIAEVFLKGGISSYLNLIKRGRRSGLDAYLGLKEHISKFTSGVDLIVKSISHIVEGTRFSEYADRAEKASNNLAKLIYEKTENGDLIKTAMEDPVQAHHGRPHKRRVEEWFEAGTYRDNEVRHSQLPYKFLLPAAHMTLRWHDVMQQLNGSKEFHSELAAVWLLANHENVAKAFFGDSPNQEEIAEAWIYTRAAAVMILYHSGDRADGLNGKEATLELISPQEIFDTIGPRFELLVPEAIREELKDQFDLLRSDNRSLLAGMEPGTDFHLVLRHFAGDIAVADKFDTLFPAKLATIRTLLTPLSRQRQLYHQDLFSDFDKNESWRSTSDVGRKIYEFKRELPLNSNKFMMETLNHNKLAAIQSTKEIFVRLMRGDIEVVNEIFEQRSKDVMTKIMSRNGPYDLNRSTRVLAGLEIERREVLSALKDKVGGYDETTILRVEALFNELLNQELIRQGKKLDGETEIKEWLPYKYYDTIASTDDMRTGLLR